MQILRHCCLPITLSNFADTQMNSTERLCSADGASMKRALQITLYF